MCTSSLQTEHYNPAQKFIPRFARTPTACVFAVLCRYATGACTPNGVRVNRNRPDTTPAVR